jgi:hypothetical protein
MSIGSNDAQVRLRWKKFVRETDGSNQIDERCAAPVGLEGGDLLHGHGEVGTHLSGFAWYFVASSSAGSDHC